MQKGQKNQIYVLSIISYNLFRMKIDHFTYSL